MATNEILLDGSLMHSNFEVRKTKAIVYVHNILDLQDFRAYAGLRRLLQAMTQAIFDHQPVVLTTSPTLNCMWIGMAF